MFNIHTYLTKIKIKAARFTLRHSSIITKIILMTIIAVICFIPIYIGIFIWWGVSPVGFWQLFVTTALLLICLGPFQIMIAIFSLALIISILVEKSKY